MSLVDDIEGEAAEDKQFIVVQRRNGNGFLVSIDGVVTDYYADDDAFMIDDLAQGHVIVVANTPSGTAPWEVEIDKIQPLASTEAWEAFGTVGAGFSRCGIDGQIGYEFGNLLQKIRSGK